MARIAGVDLPPNKRLWIGLTAIYGIGQPRARSLAQKANVDPTKKIKESYGTVMIPEAYLIDREGRIARKIVGAQDWQSPEIIGSIRVLLNRN